MSFFSSSNQKVRKCGWGTNFKTFIHIDFLPIEDKEYTYSHP
jgi:hypothetical protein